MDIKPHAMTINQLLGAKCQFVIPRFQRDYSWETTHYQEFIDDMLNCVYVKEEQLATSQYFLGTMLFIGNLDRAGQELKVVDGQQRLTTITILFSALSDHFKENGNDKLSERIFEYIMAEDDNGEKVKVLKSNTSYPFFQFYIQDRFKEEKDETPGTEEEVCIKNAYEYIYKRTSEEELRKYLSRKLNTDDISKMTYETLLKILRDQVLSSTVVTICTNDKKDANKIFEILNAKGKRLASVDLIKNRIFDVLGQTEPVDIAEEKWKKMKDYLYGGNNTVGLSTFFRQYWISKYSNSSEVKLYDNFTKKIKTDNPAEYKKLLDDLVKNAEYYSKIINPDRANYDNKKQYYWLVQSLKKLTDDFNIVQIRTLLMSLFDAREKGILKSKDFKELVLYLEGFHFAYNALLAKRANVLDSIYSNHARAIRKCNSCDEIKKEIDELRKALDKKYPKYQEFKEAFVKLCYSKEEHPDNLKAKYVINKLNCHYSESGQEVFSDDGSIEHIYPESFGGDALNIGNLILLEITLNEKAGIKDYITKKNKYYNRSAYKWVEIFISKYADWKEDDIKKRAEEMAKVFYHDILRK